MRRNAKSLVFIVVLVAAAAMSLAFKNVELGGFQRGSDTFLGLSLGLDLQGGSHLVYEAQSVVDEYTDQERTPTKEDMESLQKIILRRVNASGLGEPIIQILGEDRLLIQLPGVTDPGRAKALIGETARLVFKHRKINVPKDLKVEGVVADDDVLELRASSYPAELYERFTAINNNSTNEIPAIDDMPPVMLMTLSKESSARFDEVLNRLNVPSLIDDQLVINNRLEVSLDGIHSLKYEIPGVYVQKLSSGSKYAIEFPAGPLGTSDSSAEVNTESEAAAILGDTPKIAFVEIQGRVDEDFGLSGENLSRAYASLHATSDQPIINIEFDGLGTRIFAEKTTEIAGSPTDLIAIFLDDKELIAPTVTQPITSGTGIIQGRDFTLDRARDISLLLEGGRLPLPIELIQERDVDAILGADSLKKSALAGIIGLLLVFLFMILYYRVPGVIASIALLIYAVLVLAIFKLLPVTLTLSGVAAAILSIGMAVDANVLIFERLKDELRNGRTLNSAITIGFDRAWPAIRDSNVSTLITCAILFYFANQLGTTIVQGFAVTLAIGVVISMFSAVVVSKTMLRLVAATAISKYLGIFVPTGSRDLPQSG